MVFALTPYLKFVEQPLNNGDAARIECHSYTERAAHLVKLPEFLSGPESPS
jgi:hypothetical protein